MSDEALKAELERLKAENEALKNRGARAVSLKVSEKGGVSVYGLGRFPVTLYKEQWLKLLDMVSGTSLGVRAGTVPPDVVGPRAGWRVTNPAPDRYAMATRAAPRYTHVHGLCTPCPCHRTQVACLVTWVRVLEAGETSPRRSRTR